MDADQHDNTPRRPGREPDEPADSADQPMDGDDAEAFQDAASHADSPDRPSVPVDDDDLAPIDLEPLHEEPAGQRSKVSDLDVCPNCGAPLSGDDDVVCMRCGFDLRTLQQLQTKAEAGIASVDDDEADAGEPIADAHRPRVLLSGVLIAVVWTLLLIGYFVGMRALMPDAQLKTVGEGDDLREIISPADRLVSFLKVLVLSGTWVVCATAGLAMFARLVERRFGDLRSALIHLTAIVSTMQVARFIKVPVRSVEWTLEAASQILIFLGLSLVLLKLGRRDVLTFALITVIVVLCLFFGSHVLAWAMSG